MEKEKVKELIMKARPEAKESTIKMYSSNLEKLKKMFESDGYKFLNNIDKVKDKLKELHFTTQRNYYNAIIILLMALDEKKELIEEYSELRDKLNKQYEDTNATGTISEKQKENFVELSEIRKMIDQMSTEINQKKLKKAETLKPKDFMLIQTFILFNIYTRLPMRNDVSGMILQNKRSYNKTNEDAKKEHNYLIMEKGKMFFVLNQFKTSKKYKELDIDVPKDLEKLLRFYIRINKIKVGDVLFTSSTGKPLTRNALSQLLIKTTKKYMGKSISTTLLRKIVLSDKFSDAKKEMEAMSKITGHSTQTMSNVYVKDKDDMVKE